MKIKLKISKFTGDRKIIEIPKVLRDNFEVGEIVFIEKVKKNVR